MPVHSARPIVSVGLLLALGASLSANSTYAFEGTQWDWRVVGLSQTYETKNQALEALKNRGTNYSYLDTQEGLSDVSPQWEVYKYSVAPRGADIKTEWEYYSGQIRYPTEQQVLDAVIAESPSDPRCPPRTLTPRGPWQDTAFFFGIPKDGIRDFDDVRWNWGESAGCIEMQPLLYRMSRTRDVSCTHPFTPGNGQCVLGTVGMIQQRPQVCGVPTKHPCDIVTGSKLLHEVDYSGPALIFSRAYHSLQPQSLASLGSGWTHSYSSRLVISGTQVKARLLSNGSMEPLASRSVNVNGTWQTHWISRTGSGARVDKQGADYLVTENSNARELYSGSGKLLKRIAANGQETVIAYDSLGQIAEVVGPFGHRLTFSYSGGRLISITDPAGGQIEFVFDTAKNNLTAVRYPGGAEKIYHYENTSFPNHLTGVTDENLVRHKTVTYDSRGRVLTSEVGAGQETVTLSYGPTSTTVSDVNGGQRTYTFTADANNHRKPVSDNHGGNVRAWSIPTVAQDVQRRPTQETDPRGAVSKFTYDDHHLLSRTDAFGTANARTTSYQYLNQTSDLPTVITEPNRTTVFAYDVSGNVLTKTITDLASGVTRTWNWTRDGFGRALTEDGPRTDVLDGTSYTYYSCSTGYECGELHTVTNALSQTTTYNTYNAHGQPLTITDPNGVVTTFTYDARQRLTSRTTAGETTSIEYWPTGLLKKVTLPGGSFVLYTYDAAHRLIKVEDGEGHRIEYALDAMGNRTAENAYDGSGALARTHTRVFNTLNQLWKDVNAAGTAAVTTVYGYDATGNQTSIAAPLARNTSQLYDELNRLKQITDPASGITQFGYDANDNLTSVTDPRGLVTSYEYNGFGDLTELTSPDTGVTTSTYDSGGNLATRTDARGKTGTYSYDALNRVTQIAYPDQTLAFTYDAGTYGEGRLTGALDANHSLTFTYDAHGRVNGKSQTVGTVTHSIAYGYTNGNLTSLVTPSGQTITYGYAHGRIASVTLNGATPILSGVLYEPFGPVAGWTWGNATLAARTFDQDGKVEAIDSAGAVTYGYDDAFRITALTDLDDASRSWTHGYDALDRLTSAASSSQTIGYGYDANGNRVSQTGTQSATYTLSGTSNRLASIAGSPARTYAYDAAGNTTGYAGLAFAYSDAGRLAALTSASGTTSYLVNALGQRVRKSGPAGTRIFVYDEAGHLLGEYEGSGALVQETVWMGDIPVATLRPNGSGGVNVFYVHTDHLATPRRISRPADNAILWRWDSDPFGTTAANEDSDGDTNLFTYHLRFPGQYFDAESGLHYNYFRDYDPSVGRYVQSDPIGLEGGLNTFGYVDANPAGASDELGLKAEICCRYLKSALGFVVTPHGAFGLLQRHCYAVVNGTFYSLFPRDGSGVPERNNQDDRDSYPSKARCKECKQKIAEPCIPTAECVERFHTQYPVSPYWFLGPNSNTYTGQLARTCCEGGIPQGLGSAPGVFGVRPSTPPTRFVP